MGFKRKVGGCMFQHNQTVSDEEWLEFQKFMIDYNKRLQEKRENSLLYRIYLSVTSKDKK
jgi:hypothetical protein